MSIDPPWSQSIVPWLMIGVCGPPSSKPIVPDWPWMTMPGPMVRAPESPPKLAVLMADGRPKVIVPLPPSAERQ